MGYKFNVFTGKLDIVTDVGNSFTTIQTDSGTSPVATSQSDTLSLTSFDSSVIITGDSTTDTINFTLPFIPENVANKGIANGYASLDASSLIPIIQIPPIAWAGITDIPVPVTVLSGVNTGDQLLTGIYYHYPVDAGVIENDIVMNITNNITGQAPLSFKLAVNNGDSYYPAIYGIAKNVSGGFADIYIGKNIIVPGFNFGVFIGVDYYIDGANPGKLTYNPPAVGSGVNPIKIGRALDATHLILDPIGNFIQVKGGIYTSDGSYDEVLSPGTNGSVVVADSTQANGLKFAPALVVAAPFTYTTATRTLTVATATNSVAGILSAADHTTFAAKQSSTLISAHILVGNGSNVATDVAMSGDVAITNAGVTSITAATVTGKLITGYVSGSGTVAVTDTILQAINKLNGNNALKAPLANPIFTGDINSSTGNILISTLGKGLQVKTGTNSKLGTAILVGGTITVANTSVTANSRIFLTSQVDGGTPGFLRITAKTVGISFIITSSSVTDTSTIAWMIVESIP